MPRFIEVAYLLCRIFGGHKWSREYIEDQYTRCRTCGMRGPLEMLP